MDSANSSTRMSSRPSDQPLNPQNLKGAGLKKPGPFSFRQPVHVILCLPAKPCLQLIHCIEWIAMSKYDPAPTLAAGLVRLARRKAGLTQSELADRAGLTQQAVSAYETGRQEPTLPSLIRLINAAGFELRMHLELLDDHDTGLERFMASLPNAARAEIEEIQRKRVEAARLDRIRGH